jgi:hypothetical protein
MLNVKKSEDLENLEKPSKYPDVTIYSERIGIIEYSMLLEDWLKRGSPNDAL